MAGKAICIPLSDDAQQLTPADPADSQLLSAVCAVSTFSDVVANKSLDLRGPDINRLS